MTIFPAVLSAYRSTPHSSTGLSPYRMVYGVEMTMPIGGTRNTSCAIWCLEIKAFLTTKCCMMVGKTIVTNGVLDNINIQVFKLARLANSICIKIYLV